MAKIQGLNEIEVLTESATSLRVKSCIPNAIKDNPIDPEVCLIDVYARQSRQFKAAVVQTVFEHIAWFELLGCHSRSVTRSDTFDISRHRTSTARR